MEMTLDTLPERPSYVRNAEHWEAACQRNGTILLPCGIAEFGQWHCPQYDRLRPSVDFDRLWLRPGRKIEYHGSIDLLARYVPKATSKPKTLLADAIRLTSCADGSRLHSADEPRVCRNPIWVDR